MRKRIYLDVSAIIFNVMKIYNFKFVFFEDVCNYLYFS